MFKKLLSVLVLSYFGVFTVNTVRTSDVPTQSTFLIETADHTGNGTGVLIAPEILLTARHVADAVDSVPLYVNGQQVSVISKSEDSDLALLRVPGLTGSYANIGDGVDVGDGVKAVGYPMHYILKSIFQTEGKVSALVDDTVYSTAPILPGNSGGGLWHHNWLGVWELDGITVSVPVVPLGMFAMTIAVEFDMAINAQAIHKFLGD